MLARIPSRDTQTVVTALIRQTRKLPDELYKSLTWDRGKELADHKRFTMQTDIDAYFLPSARLFKWPVWRVT
jgi:IS30 family transposase